MSKINAVRLININYNNNAIRISDETFHFNGESTLVSLRNGGGKSVLVQMMMAPFVHKRYRDAKDRPFESYFTTNKPSFILVEWALDGGAGYVMTGMMVRRSQDSEENGGENLEMVNFVSEYQRPCVQDIHHLPVVEKGKREIVLKNFAACRQMFDGYKKDPSMKFFCYNMANSAQSRQYFDKLLEYQVNYKEWEGIIKKVNLKESGLSDLFSDCRDEKGLVERWFLDAVENKLNKDRNRMKEFQVILEKYVGQYKDNQSKIKRRDNIRLFQEEAVRIAKKNDDYRECEREVQDQENKIACFRKELEALHQCAIEDEQRNHFKAEDIRREISYLEYEKLSEEYYGLEEEKRFHAGNRDMIEMERESLEREAEHIEQKLHLLSCAKQQKVVDEEREEWELCRQQLAVARERSEDLEPERGGLGYLLRSHYQSALAETEDSLKENQKEREAAANDMEKEQAFLAELEESLRKNALCMGELKSKIGGYDRQEEQFNKQYHESLARNILGEYEPGSLEIYAKNCQKSLEDAVRRKAAIGRELEQMGGKKTSLEHQLAAQKEEKIQAAAQRRQQEELKESYEEELARRRGILKYFALGEESLFQEEKIFQAADRKLNEIEGIRRNLEKEENELQKEFKRLTEGKVLELPAELEAEFELQGIHMVYGMEWLKKNGYSEVKNRELVRCHPFLPYALILSEGEMEKLSHFEGKVPTASPIPIILRKDLEQNADRGQNLQQFSQVSFYVLFNENLLDEEKLLQLVEEKERQIAKKQEMIAIRRQEYSDYFAWKEQVRNQKVCRENYKENEDQLAKLEEKLQKLEADIRTAMAELTEGKERINGLEKEIKQAEHQIEEWQRREADFKELCKAYEEYRENRREQEQCKKEETQYMERQKLSREKCEKLKETLASLQNGQAELERQKERQQEQSAVYQGYETAGGPEIMSALSGMSLSEMEARYMAVTSAVSQELQELEAREQKNLRRHQQAQEELKHLAGKYRLAADAWKDTAYSRKEESSQEIYLEDRRGKIKLKDSQWNEEDKKIALLMQQMKDRLQRMASECEKEAPLPKEEIRKEDYDSRRAQLDYQYQELQKAGRELQDRLHSYDENLTALAEYSELPVREAVTWEEDFARMDAKSLRSFKGILLRDYHRQQNDRQRARERLLHVLNQVVRMEQFQEDFYRKPLEAMMELSGDGEQVQRQLETTVQSYQNLMEKLEVDISFVERERDKIVELLEDYLSKVHQTLGKIDHNSTISIRERPVKMLKIQLPSWEENESIYQIRLQDFMKEVTRKGIEIFDRNENAQEYFGTQMTTKNLYDTVVGISNVQIRLYKIEEQREYPITWAEVAKNSGGEGFLSAFVVLSSLLYFMRRDETDIFADRNEGKVLLMDNPFAQTNAAHLLKPLMDMALKTNTQLICLTGLGGESIYSRFDNIYVLNLIAASLRQGTQYLRSEHFRGNEPETMITSQIEVIEQQVLEF